MGEYTRMWSYKYLADGAGTLGEVVRSLEDGAWELRDMGRDGVALEGVVEDGHALLATDDPEVARKYEFEEDEGEEPLMPAEHKQVPIQWCGLEVEVDEEMAPLVLALWRSGIPVTGSCQECMPGFAWLEFPTSTHAAMFLDKVCCSADEGEAPVWETLYGRVAGLAGVNDNWRYDVSFQDGAVRRELVNGEAVPVFIGPPSFDVAVSVRFPRADLPLVLRRLNEDAARRGPAGICPGCGEPLDDEDDAE